MYRAFNLTACDWNDISRENGDAIYKRNADTVRRSLESFLNDKIVDGTKLKAHWFPTFKADVFISHSHMDEVDAIKCAGWLKDQFGLEGFIDSCIWGHADDLLRIIDRKYCLNPNGETYDYDKRNGSTSHVHMMLSIAIAAMLEAAECVLFINTPNSITSNESVSKTQSPWLFFELGTMRIIGRKKPERKIVQEEHFAKKATDLKVEYEVPLSELTPLNFAHLNAWRDAHQTNPSNKGKHTLDLLYEIAPETK